MSNYSGHDRPYPAWFPYFLVAILVVGAAVYMAARDHNTTPSSSSQTQDDMNIARYKPGIVSKRRA